MMAPHDSQSRAVALWDSDTSGGAGASNGYAHRAAGRKAAAALPLGRTEKILAPGTLAEAAIASRFDLVEVLLEQGAEAVAREVREVREADEAVAALELHIAMAENELRDLVKKPPEKKQALRVLEAAVRDARTVAEIQRVELKAAETSRPNDPSQFFADCSPLYWAVHHGFQSSTHRAPSAFHSLGGHERTVEVFSRSADEWRSATVLEWSSTTAVLPPRMAPAAPAEEALVGTNTVEYRTPSGETKHQHVMEGSDRLRRPTIISLLLAHGAQPEWPHPRGGTTPLHLAASHGDLEAVEGMLFCGCNPDVLDSYGKTPLICAARWGYPACYDALIATGADPTIRSPYEGTAADAAKLFQIEEDRKSAAAKASIERVDRLAQMKQDIIDRKLAAEARIRALYFAEAMLWNAVARVYEEWDPTMREKKRLRIRAVFFNDAMFWRTVAKVYVRFCAVFVPFLLFFCCFCTVFVPFLR